MKKLFYTCCGFFFLTQVLAQDTDVVIYDKYYILSEVVVRNNFDYKKVLRQIQNDTSFYKAFKNLRILNYTALNNINIFDKDYQTKASLYSKTKQIRKENCRIMEIMEETVTGDFYNKKKEYNYLTAQLYAHLFFTKEPVCNETNSVGDINFSLKNKTGMDKHKEQLKMLFFNPGKKIPNIPFIGDKLDLYDEEAKKLYSYRLDLEEKESHLYYIFTIKPKNDLNFFQRSKIVVDEMITWFDQTSLDVFYRKYVLSYNTGIYKFNVTMEVQMTHVGSLIVPRIMRYIGDWNILFTQRERANFTATLFDFKF